MNNLELRTDVLMLVHSIYSNDSRVRRSVRTLVNQGYTVYVIALWPIASSVEAEWVSHQDGCSLLQIGLKHASGKARFIEMMQKAHQVAKKFKAIRCLHAHDLDALLPAAAIAKEKKAALIYDAHEWYTGSIHTQHRWFTRSIWKLLEWWLLPQVDELITVNQSIATLFEQHYGSRLKEKVHVVRNFDEPVAHEAEPLVPEAFKAFASKFEHLLAYGGYLQKGRGLEESILALKQLPETVGLFIAGEGSLRASLEQLCLSHKLQHRVLFTGLLSLEDLYAHYRYADIGLCFIEAASESYRLSLPNKLSQYALSGIAIVGSQLPEIERIIHQYELGLCSSTGSEMASVIKEVIDKLDIFKKNSRKAAHDLTWLKEQHRLVQVYHKVLK